MLCRKLASCSIGVPVLLRRLFLVPSSHSMSAAALPAGDARPLNTASTKPVPEGFSSVLEGSASIIHETGHVFYNPAQVQNRDLSIACLNVFSKIYRQEKEALAAKRSSRHAAQSTGVSPTAASGEVAAVDAAGEYKGLRILEGAFRRTLCALSDQPLFAAGLSASGLRSIRYAKEIPDLDFVVANDMLPAGGQDFDYHLCISLFDFYICFLSLLNMCSCRINPAQPPVQRHSYRESHRQSR